MIYKHVELDVKDGAETRITVTLPYKSELHSTDKIETRIYIDLFGNGKVMLPQRNKPVTCKAQVVFG